MAEGMNGTWIRCHRGPEEERVCQVLTQTARVTTVFLILGVISQDSRAEREIKKGFAMGPSEYLHQKKKKNQNKYIRKM